MESIYSDTFSLFTPNQDIENMEYYDSSEYFISKALSNWSIIINKAYESNGSRFSELNIKIWSNVYRQYLSSLIDRDDIILFNGLTTFDQIVTFCNSHHQKILLKYHVFECPHKSIDDIDYIQLDDAHNVCYFNSINKCNENHDITFNNVDSSYYNYLGFINENIPVGIVESI